MENWAFVTGAALVAIAALGLAFLIAKAIYIGALMFLQWALEQRFVGVVAFAACWFFMLPLTLIACAVVGFGVMWAVREHKRHPAVEDEEDIQCSANSATVAPHTISEPADVWKGVRGA